MTQSRASQISTADTTYYHCMAHVIRNTYLSGIDPVTSVDYGERKQWIVDRIKLFGSAFAIDVAAYSVMSTHYHVVLNINEEEARSWSNKEVFRRWRMIFLGSKLLRAWADNKLTSVIEVDAAEAELKIIRNRLTDISWFMGKIEEYIARRANSEDDCKGCFWNGRFKSQALLDEKAVIACMVYVDLNPIRANIAKSIQDSKHTSAYERLNILINSEKNEPKNDYQIKPLMPFSDPKNDKTADKVIKFELKSYLELLDWTSRVQREDKIGYVNEELPDFFIRLGVTEKNWLILTTDLENVFHCAIGTIEELDAFAKHTNRKWLNTKRMDDLLN